jgi:ribosome modulation factor
VPTLEGAGLLRTQPDCACRRHDWIRCCRVPPLQCGAVSPERVPGCWQDSAQLYASDVEIYVRRPVQTSGRSASLNVTLWRSSLSVPRRILTRVRAVFRARHLSKMPRSPHRDTPEFAKGWRDAMNEVSKARCPYSSPLFRARWQHGFEAALVSHSRRARRKFKGADAASTAELLASGGGRI